MGGGGEDQRLGTFVPFRVPSKPSLSISRENESLLGSGSVRAKYKLMNKNIPGHGVQQQRAEYPLFRAHGWLKGGA